MRVLLSLFFTMISVYSGQTAHAHTPVEFLEVIRVEPSHQVEHAVELKSQFDSEKVSTVLKGPRFFARSIGCLGREEKRRPAFLNWYEITNQVDETERNIEILDLVRGGDSKALKLGNAEYYLNPAQLIRSGKPEPIPEGLDRYKAYRVVDPPIVEQRVRLTAGSETEDRTLLKPVLVCLPVREWHHDDFFSATHPRDCFVIYQLSETSDAQILNTIDQFGLNELRSIKSQWIGVRATLLRSP